MILRLGQGQRQDLVLRLQVLNPAAQTFHLNLELLQLGFEEDGSPVVMMMVVVVVVQHHRRRRRQRRTQNERLAELVHRRLVLNVLHQMLR